MFDRKYVVNFYASVLIGSGSGGAGVLETVRNLLWIKIEQNTTRTLKIKVLSHLHHLSLHWHLSRKTGEVLRIIDRGTESVNSLFNYVLFNMIPAFADVIIAVIYLTMTFNIWSVRLRACITHIVERFSLV